MTDIDNVRARVEAARDFPSNTCSSSRHVQLIGETLVEGLPYPMLQEEPRHIGRSLLATVAALYEARSELLRLHAAPQPPAEAQPAGDVLPRMDQLRRFVAWEREHNPDKTHIAEWALYELRRLYVAPPPSAPVGVEGVAAQLRRELEAGTDKDYPYTEYEKGRIAEKERLLAILAHHPPAENLNEPFGDSEELPPAKPRFIKVRDSIRGTVAVSKVFPGDVIAEEYDTQQPADVGEVRIPRALADRVMTALGKFTSDEGWSAVDMEAADDFSALAGQQGDKS